MSLVCTIWDDRLLRFLIGSFNGTNSIAAISIRLYVVLLAEAFS